MMGTIELRYILPGLTPVYKKLFWERKVYGNRKTGSRGYIKRNCI